MKDDEHIHRPVVKTLWPGQAGTLKPLRRFGEELVCVRYRHDVLGEMRFTTAEVIIDCAPIRPRIAERAIVAVRIAHHEVLLRARAKALGAKWHPEAKAWVMSMRVARSLDLAHRARKR